MPLPRILLKKKKTSLQSLTERRQHKLYDRSANHFLFQLYGQAVKRHDVSQTKDVTTTLKIIPRWLPIV